ncbi:MAG TPA: MFS transporter [Kineosporiaceae bacterium]|nr:MFS transporter [Kineosporiaceae bacterium]
MTVRTADSRFPRGAVTLSEQSALFPTGFLVTGLFAAGLATFALLYAPQPLLPTIAGQYHLDPASASLVISVSTAGLMTGVVPVAVAGRRRDRRLVMLGSLAVAAVLGLLVAAAPTWPLLLLLRGLQGMALSGVPAMAVSYATERAGISRAGLVSGLYVAGTTVGGLSGRVVAGILGDVAGWRVGLGWAALMGAVATAVAWLLLPVGRGVHHPRPPRPTGRAWAAFSALWRDADSLQLGLCLIAALLMAAFVATYNTMTFRLTREPYLLSPTTVGLVFLTYLAGTLASAVAGRLADRLPRRLLVACSALLVTGGAALMSARPLGLVVTGLAMLTAGFFAAHGVANGWVGLAASRHRGTATARYTVWYYAGSTLGGPLGGLALSLGGWTATALLVETLGVTAAMIALLLPAQAAAGAHRMP